METIPVINKRLLDIYGKFETGDANWRVVWSKDQFEKRKGTFDKISENGVYMGQETGIVEAPKYNYLQPQWILERLTPVPPNFVLDIKISYECMWAFGFDHFGNPLPPKWEACEVVIATMFEQMNRQIGVAKYETPLTEMNNPEGIKARIDIMEDLLFEKSRIGDRLAIGEGVSMSGAYKENKVG